MAKVEIYTTMLCGYCYRAKKLLQERGAEFTGNRRDDRRQAARRNAQTRRRPDLASRRFSSTTQHVGGCDDLYALDQAGKLQPLLHGQPLNSAIRIGAGRPRSEGL